MKLLLRALSLCLFVGNARALEIDDFIDRLDSAITSSAFNDNIRTRLSGTIDFEVYHFQQPAPELIDSKIDNLFNPRLSLFVDAQFGKQIYFFAQSRLDRRFDPSNHGAAVRLDEYALRVTPWEDGRLNLQIGKFATVVGNFVPRHLSWENPFITAPLPYENLTAISDVYAPRRPREFIYEFAFDEDMYNPLIWGPSYAPGGSVAGKVGKFSYALEIKNSALASRPKSWDASQAGFDNPTFSGRIGFRPNQAWNFGFSA